MIDKQSMKERQPVAWKILSNALRSGNLSHAYLFYGEKGPDQSHLALLFAQSISCRHPDEDGFACQQCEVCRQIEKEVWPDFYWLHPGGLRTRKPLTRKELDAWWKNQTLKPDPAKNWRLKKEDILRLQDTFAYSSSTEAGKQVYIIEQYEQATSSASNTLLKFLEEPKPDLTGILCTSAIHLILPTIVSRCQLIPLRPSSRASLEAEIGQLIDDPLMCAILARAGYDENRISALLDQEALFELRDAALDYWKAKDSHGAIVRLQTGVFSKTGFPTREAAEFFLNCLLYFLDQEKVSALSLDLKTILLDSLDALRIPLDPVLLIERTARDIRQRLRKR